MAKHRDKIVIVNAYGRWWWQYHVNGQKQGRCICNPANAWCARELAVRSARRFAARLKVETPIVDEKEK